jgi:hypothetical protein
MAQEEHLVILRASGQDARRICVKDLEQNNIL